MTPGSVRLVRHASTDWSGVRLSGRADPPLSAAGLREAAALADRVATEVGDGPVPVLVASPSRRALETAEAIRERLGVDHPRLDPDLRETDVGLAEGLTFDETRARFPELADALLAGRIEIDWPGGERSADLRVRARRAWDRLRLAAEGGQDLIVVSHGWLIAVVVSLATGDPSPVVLHPTGEVRVAVRDGRWQVERTAAGRAAGG